MLCSTRPPTALPRGSMPGSVRTARLTNWQALQSVHPEKPIFSMYPQSAEVVKLPPTSYTSTYTPTSTYAAATYLSPTRRYSPRGESPDDDVRIRIRASGRCPPDNCVASMRAETAAHGHGWSMRPLALTGAGQHNNPAARGWNGAAESVLNDGGAGALMDEHAELMALVRRHGKWPLVPGVAPRTISGFSLPLDVRWGRAGFAVCVSERNRCPHPWATRRTAHSRRTECQQTVRRRWGRLQARCGLRASCTPS